MRWLECSTAFAQVRRVFVTVVVRQPRVDELRMLSDMCMRSKAVWGYNEQFIEACREELTLTVADLESTFIATAEVDGQLAGVAQIEVIGDEANLLKLFVEPEALRSGIGCCLFDWACNTARKLGAQRVTIEADPDAAPFYRRMGARDIGLAPSESIPGRVLPKLALNLG